MAKTLDMIKYLSSLPGYQEWIRCPQCEELDKIMYGAKANTKIRFLHGAIIHLNDVHKWSREQIADWLETLEEKGIDLAFKEKDGTST